MMGGSGISWTICKSFASHSRQITTSAPHHSIFYKPDALPDAKPTMPKHWRQTVGEWRQLENEVVDAAVKQWHKQRRTLVNLSQRVPPYAGPNPLCIVVILIQPNPRPLCLSDTIWYLENSITSSICYHHIPLQHYRQNRWNSRKSLCFIAT